MHHVLDDPFGHARKHNHHKRAHDGAAESARSQPRVPLQIGEHAPDRFHSPITSCSAVPVATSPRLLWHSDRVKARPRNQRWEILGLIIPRWGVKPAVAMKTLTRTFRFVVLGVIV